VAECAAHSRSLLSPGRQLETQAAHCGCGEAEAREAIELQRLARDDISCARRHMIVEVTTECIASCERATVRLAVEQQEQARRLDSASANDDSSGHNS